MAKWKAGYLVTINKKTYRITRRYNVQTIGICACCDFLHCSVDKSPCKECIDGNLMPEDCALVRVYTARDFSKPLELSDKELQEIEDLELLKM